MKVLFCYRIPTTVLDYFRSHLPKEIELICPQQIEESTLLELASNVDVIIGYKVSKDLLESAKELKHIQVPWTGSETLDFELLKNYPQITVSNSHSNALVIAEHAIALLLAAAKLIVRSDRLMREGNWSARYDNHYSSLLSEKTLGIIGYGAIGKFVAKTLKEAFKMKILAIKRHPENIDSECVYDYLGGQDRDEFEYVLSNSNFLLVTLPLTAETRNIIGERELSLMRPDSIIVNISRGPVINEVALFNHLKQNKDFRAGLDVWYNYPKDRKNPVNVHQNLPFHELDNIILSPHRAFRIHERGDVVSAKDVIDNLLLISRGEKPKNQLNLDLGY